MIDIEKQLSIIKRGAVEIISQAELRKKLELSFKEKRPLVIKAGFDPTAPDIHLGHSVLLRKLRQFQDLGHRVVFLIGDFTAQIGDPSGKSRKRIRLSREEVELNALTYKRQVSKILDLEKLEVVFNSQWFKTMSLLDMLELTTHSTVAQMLAREDFKKRIAKKEDLSLLEFMYPILQGYDSVVLKADVELGGTDQIFNLLVGRDMQKDLNLPEQVVITMPLLEGIDGVQKMSKSLGNYIGITEPPKEIFGKLMSISDALMLKYYELLTDADLSEIKKMHPKEAKVRLAGQIIAQYYSPEIAQHQQDEFQRVFSRKEAPGEIEEFQTDGKIDILKVMLESKIAKSGNEARRLLKAGAVSFSGVKISEEKFRIAKSGVLKVGSHRFLKINCH